MRVTLFHVIRPPTPHSGWNTFRQESQLTVALTEDVQRLCENVWLIGEGDRLLSLVQLATLSTKYRLAYRTLEFDLVSGWQDHPVPQ